MKKILIILVLSSFLGVMAAMMVSAQVPTPEVTQCTMRQALNTPDWKAKGFECPAKGNACLFDSTTYTCGSCCVMDTVYTVIDWVFVIVTAIAMIMLVLGAFEIVTAGGVVEKVTKGRTYIIYALVGFFVAILAKAIPSIVKNILGM